MKSKTEAILNYIIPILFGILTFYFSCFHEKMYRAIFQGELGIVENIQVACLATILLISLFTIILKNKFLSKNKFLYLFFILLFIGTIYLLGEEISWGQHYIGWETKGVFLQVNDQSETNIHNTSSWFDQKPKMIIETAIIYFYILIFLKLKINTRARELMNKHGLAVLLPEKNLMFLALFIQFYKILDKLHVEKHVEFLQNMRYSEIQETLIYYLIAVSLFYILKRINHSAPSK